MSAILFLRARQCLTDDTALDFALTNFRTPLGIILMEANFEPSDLWEVLSQIYLFITSFTAVSI